VSDLPPSLLQSQGVSLSMQSSPHGGEDEEKDLKKGSQSAPPSASPRVPTPLPKVTSRMVMQYSGGDETVLQARSMVMKARERLYEKCPAFFSFILSTMTAPSRAVVQGHPDFLEAHTSSDVFSLLRIVKGTHLINLEAEAMRMEKKLQEMRLGVKDFTTYASKFHDLIIGLDNVGSKLSTERIVFIFLFSLKSSPLQRTDCWTTRSRKGIQTPSKRQGTGCI
jgi:hypothetical protein